MKKEYIDFVCSMHGYMIRTKEIHWSTKFDAIHRMCDEIEQEIHDLEDRFAECVMGIEDKKFQIGDLKPLLPNSNDIISMMKELEGETKAMKKKVKGDDNGLNGIYDAILEFCNKYKYRGTQLNKEPKAKKDETK